MIRQAVLVLQMAGWACAILARNTATALVR